jgi:maltooligosyltrehalose trehalohydrolase
MAEFTVWAPHRSRMAVVVEGKKTDMEPTRSGWWVAHIVVDDDSDYLFELDENLRLPDPRSRFQPDGVHGVSRLVDADAFVWTDRGFQASPLSSAVIYELHVGTFTPQGTFESATEKLKHLTEFGVTHVELMPVVEFAGSRGWGYDGVYAYAPHHNYGGPYGLQRFVDACHAEDLGVILDVVYNHLGPAGNYLPQYAPYFTERYKTPWGSAINFDGPYSDEVRRYFIDSAMMWLRDYHVDGLRVDAIHAIVDRSATPFLEQLAIEVKQLEAHLGRHLVMIAESDLNDPRVIQSRERGGFGFDAQWSDDFHHALHVALAEEKHGYYGDFCGLQDLAGAYKQPFLFNQQFSGFRQRSHGRPTGQLEGWKFVAYSQNHDQVGNRASGERLHHIAGIRRTKIAAALTFFSPYVPLVFQGEEWAANSPFQYFVDFGDDPELARAVSQGRRQEFGGFHGADVPDPQSELTFCRSKLDWNELNETPHREMLDWYRQLIALRRRTPSLSDGSLDAVVVELDDDCQWLSVQRANVQLIANLAAQPRNIKSKHGQRMDIVMASDPQARLDQDGFRLPAECVVIAQEVSSPSGRSAPLAGHKRESSRLAEASIDVS